MRLVSLAIFLLLLTPDPLRAKDMNKNHSFSRNKIDEECIKNLQYIYGLLNLYLHHSGGALPFPSDFEVLYEMSKKPKAFICPGDMKIDASVKTRPFRTSYQFVNDPLKSKLSAAAPGKIAIVAEKEPNHDGVRFVLFYDGSVRAFDTTNFDKLKNHCFIASNSDGNR